MDTAAAKKTITALDMAPLESQVLVERIADLAWDKKALGLRALRVLERPHSRQRPHRR